MKQILVSILLLCLCIGLLTSCEKKAAELDETTFTITIPDADGITLTFTNVYPMYFQPMSGDGEAGKPYLFAFKENGTVKSDKPISLYTADYIDGDIAREEFSLEAGEAFAFKTGKEYSAWAYSDGRILAEYEKIPVASLTFLIVTEEEYKISLEEEYKYGKNHSINTLKY